jgi:hypothetical protein
LRDACEWVESSERGLLSKKPLYPTGAHSLVKQLESFDQLETEVRMKVFEIFGSHGETQKGIFQYKRTSVGLRFDSSVGIATLNLTSVELTNTEWCSILEASNRRFSARSG